MGSSEGDVVTITEARATLPELIDRVEAGARITVTRHGRPVAVIGQPHPRREIPWSRGVLDARATLARVAARRGTELPDDAGYTADDAERHVAELRADRDAR